MIKVAFFGPDANGLFLLQLPVSGPRRGQVLVSGGGNGLRHLPQRRTQTGETSLSGWSSNPEPVFNIRHVVFSSGTTVASVSGGTGGEVQNL